MPDSVEFLDDSGRGSDGGDDPLAADPHRRLPRWTHLLVALVIAALIAGLVEKLHGNSSGPVAAPSTPTASASSQTLVHPGPAEPVAGIQSAAFVGSELVTVQLGTIRRADLPGLAHVRTVHPGLPIGDPSYADWNLVTDGRGLWLLGGVRVYRLDPLTLQLGALNLAPGAIEDAAVLDGDLYLTTDTGVYRIASSATKARRAQGLRGGRRIAADPARHRLLLIDEDSANASIRTYRPGAGDSRGKSGRSRELPLGGASIAVVHGAIWVAGTSASGDRRPIVMRLDPRTLVVSRTSQVASQLGATVKLIAGEHSLFVRSSGSGNQLWCLDPGTGRIAQHWASASGQVVSRADEAVLTAGGTVRTLHLNGRCRG